MSVVIKSQAKATNEFRVLEDGNMKSIMIQPGRNVVNEDVYESLKAHSGFESFVNRDIITINTVGAIAKKAAKEPDFTYVEGLAGNEDGKDVIKEYALAWNINLNKKKTVENMILDFKEQYEGK
jgi:hypothetical protein